jgi:hypothetical protein
LVQKARIQAVCDNIEGSAMMRRLLVLAVTVPIIGSSVVTLADAPDPGPLFGPEFTVQGEYGDDLLRHLESHLIDHQPPGEKFSNPLRKDYKFESPDNWWFDVWPDSGGMGIEIHTKPMTVDDFEKVSGDMEDAIFVSTRNLNMWPALFRGGGHINMDLNYFTDKPILFRNFLVDFVNHSELAMGILNYDTNNAVPIPLSPEIFNQFKQKIALFDQVIQDSSPANFRSPALTTLLAELIYEGIESIDHPFGDQWQWPEGSPITKYTSISLYHSYGLEDDAGSRRIEIRSVRAQGGMDQWLRQIRLLRDRLRFLHKTYGETLLPISVKVPIDFVSPEFNKLVPPVKPQRALQAFFVYVREAGHQWMDHRDYLWPAWIARQPGEAKSELELFEESDWFKSQMCKAILQ